MEKWEKKRVDELRIKQVDKLIQTVQLVIGELSLVGVQSDMVVPAVPIVVEGASRTSYASVTTQASVEVAALAPVSPVPPATGARALVVHGVSCQQSMAWADILRKV